MKTFREILKETKVAYGHRNVTHNGTPRVTSTSKEKADAELEKVRKKHPDVHFEPVTFHGKDEKVSRYVPGKGRAGNSYKQTTTQTHWKVKK